MVKDFEKVYGIQLKDMIQRIDTELTKKYTEPMDFNWNDLNQNCIEQYLACCFLKLTCATKMLNKS